MVSSRQQRCRAGSVAIVAVVLSTLWSSSPTGQSARKFAARLSTVPITVAMQDAVSGRGTADATLAGNHLTIDGTFEGLRSPATAARLHAAPRAMRGPAIADLTVSKDTRGVVGGSVELTDQQLQALDKSGLYIQIHSEKAPDGNLWGWLLPEEVKK
jgi:hypothetical protein